MLVTVDAAMTPKWAAVPIGTGAATAARSTRDRPRATGACGRACRSGRADQHTRLATARAATAASRDDEMIMRMVPVMVVTMGFRFLNVLRSAEKSALINSLP